MRALLFYGHRKRILDPDDITVDFIQETVRGDFEGISLPSPDESLPADEQRLFLYYNVRGRERSDMGPSVALGRNGQLVYGPVLLVGIKGDVERGLTDRELKTIYYYQPSPELVPVLELRGFQFGD